MKNQKIEIEIEDKTHAKLSASGSKRWMTCPGSIALEHALNLPRSSSIHAATGTVAHELHDRALKTGLKLETLIGRTIECEGFQILIDQNMIEAVQESINYIQDRICEYELDGYEVELQTEIRASLEFLRVAGLDGGTCDVLIIARSPIYGTILDVIDYKHGQGVAVEVENNSQLLCYATGAMHALEQQGEIFDRINLIVAQPRSHHPEGRIRQWSLSPIQLIEWCDNELVPAAQATAKPDPIFKPDPDACRWCPSIGACAALAKKSQETIAIDFAEIDVIEAPTVQSLSIEQKTRIAVNAPLIREFLNAVELTVHNEILAGSQDYTKFFKVVEKITRRKLTDLAFDPIGSPLLDYLEDSQLYKRVQVGIGEIEKQLKSKLKPDQISELMTLITDKPAPDLAVAFRSDKRKEVSSAQKIEDDFKDL